MAETEEVLNEVRKTVDDVIAQIKARKLHIYFNWSRNLLVNEFRNRADVEFTFCSNTYFVIGDDICYLDTDLNYMTIEHGWVEKLKNILRAIFNSDKVDPVIKAIFTCPTKWDMSCGRGD